MIMIMIFIIDTPATLAHLTTVLIMILNIMSAK